MAVKIAVFSITSIHASCYINGLPIHKKYDWVAVSVAPKDRSKVMLDRVAPGVKIYENEEDLLDAHPDLDAVILAGANYQTYDEFIEAYFKDCSGKVKEHIAYFDRLTDNMEKRGYSGDIHTGVQLHPEYYELSEIRSLERILKEALDKANSISEMKLSRLLFDRIYPLTFFYKWVLLCCFGDRLSQDEFQEIVCDLKYNTQKYSVREFRSVYSNLVRDDLCVDVLNTIENNKNNCRDIL